jgi:hypothetical protein
MRPLSTPELVRAWESGAARTPAERALLLLAHACPEESWEELAALPIGRRDARLLTLREWTLGPALNCVARCPSCAEPVELNFSVADVRDDTVAVPGELSLEAHGYTVAFRLPSSTDLSVVDDRRALLARCLSGAEYRGRKRSLKRLPAKVLDAVVRRMAEADPQADVHTTLTCPACDHDWRATFDIVTFFLAELEVWVYRVLRDVHRLASAYGWREADILALSPRRRQFYLELVG